MTTKHAVALRAFDHAGDSFAPGAPFPLAAGHLVDWSAAGLVREATAVEIARAKGEKSAPRTKGKRKVKAAPTRSAVPEEPAPPASTATDPDPAAPAA